MIYEKISDQWGFRRHKTSLKSRNTSSTVWKTALFGDTKHHQPHKTSFFGDTKPHFSEIQNLIFRRYKTSPTDKHHRHELNLILNSYPSPFNSNTSSSESNTSSIVSNTSPFPVIHHRFINITEYHKHHRFINITEYHKHHHRHINIIRNHKHHR